MKQDLKSLRFDSQSFHAKITAIKTEKWNRDLESIPVLAANLLTDGLEACTRAR